MPIYTYKNQNGEEKDFILSIEEMEGNRTITDDSGETWQKTVNLFSAGSDSVSNIDPFDKDSFMRATEEKTGEVGDLLDISEEMSRKRAEACGGEDPVKRKMFDDYEEKNGTKHLEDKVETFEDDNVIIDMRED